MNTEDNRRSGVALAMRHRLCDYVPKGSVASEKEDKHSAICSCIEYGILCTNTGIPYVVDLLICSKCFCSERISLELAATLRWFTARAAIRIVCTTTFANLEITSL